MTLTHTASPEKPVSIFAVVVIYRVAPMESSSVTSLLAAARFADSTGLRLRIRIADNTPGGHAAVDLPPELEYCSDPANPGLAKPYNDALQVCAAEDFGWLLTLDQDSAGDRTAHPYRAGVCEEIPARDFHECEDSDSRREFWRACSRHSISP